jgi:hypothetical protein
MRRSAITSQLISGKNNVVFRARYLANHKFRNLVSSPKASQAICYYVYAGLGNRLRSHYLAEQLAERMKRKVFPIWIPTSQLASDGSDIFSDHIDHGEARGNAIWPVSHSLVRVSEIELGRFQDIETRSSGKLAVLDFQAQFISFERSRSICGMVPVTFDFRNNILAESNAIMAGLPRPVLAAHVRQTDFISHTDHARPVSYFEDLILAELERGGGYRTLLVVSDDFVVISENVRRRFEKTHCLAPRYLRYEKKVAPEALTHLLSLASSNTFIGSPRSSFSEFVAEIRSGNISIKGFGT